MEDFAIDTILHVENGAAANNRSRRTAIARIDEAWAAARARRSRFFPEGLLNKERVCSSCSLD